MAAINNPFARRLINTEGKFVEAKFQVEIFDMLTALEIPEKYAKTIVDSSDWSAVLESDEFDEDEKTAFRMKTREMQKALDAVYVKSIDGLLAEPS